MFWMAVYAALFFVFKKLNYNLFNETRFTLKILDQYFLNTVILFHHPLTRWKKKILYVLILLFLNGLIPLTN